MSSIFNWNAAFSQQLTISLLHFMWQGGLIALFVFVAGRMLRRSSAQLRYCTNVVAMLLLLGCLPLTFTWLSDTPFENQNHVTTITSNNDLQIEVVPTANVPLPNPTSPQMTGQQQAQPPLVITENSHSLLGIDRVSESLKHLPDSLTRGFTTLYFVGVGLMLVRLGRVCEAVNGCAGPQYWCSKPNCYRCSSGKHTNCASEQLHCWVTAMKSRYRLW